MAPKTNTRLDPVLFACRIYNREFDQDTPLDKMGPFVCVFSVFAVGQIAVIFAMHGEFTRKAYDNIKRELQKRGVKRVYFERHRNGASILKEVLI